MHKTIITSDGFNALYDEDGNLEHEGRPDHLDAETLARTIPTAALYHMPEDVYDDVLDGRGYPANLSGLPLARMTKYR